MNTPSAPPPAHPSGAARARSPVVLRILNAVERLGNRLPDPITLFALFAVAVVLALRAVARLPGLVEYMLPLAKLRGRCIAIPCAPISHSSTSTARPFRKS